MRFSSKAFFQLRKISFFFSFFILIFFSHKSFGEVTKTVDLLILGGTLVTMDENRLVINNGGIAIDKGEILAVGSADEIRNSFFSSRILSAHGKAIIPGLINGHTHMAMSLLRGIADDLDLHEWLNDYIFPIETSYVNEDFVRSGTRLSLAEMIKGGITTVVDMYFFEDAVAEEASKAGMRGIFGQAVLDFPTPDSQTFHEAMEKAHGFIKKWQKNSLITPAIAPHALYTVSEEHLKLVSELSHQTSSPILIHLSETKEDVDKIVKEKGASPLFYLNKMGFLNNHVIAAHVVFPQKDEISLMKELQVGVIHNPKSNMKLASGIAPISQMLIADLNLGLGTDGAASNNSLNLWEEMDTAAKLHKVTTGNPKAVSAIEAFEMATIRGTRALRLDHKIGSIERKKKADLVIVDLDGLHQIPHYNIYSTLVYATKSTDVRTVIINGVIVMLDRKLLTLDEACIKEEAYRYQKLIKKGSS